MPPSCTERQDFNHWWLLETTWPFCCLLSFCQALCHIGVRFYLRLLINCLYHVWIDTGITSGIILTLVWHFLSFFGQVPWPCWTASTVPSLGLICSYGKSPNISLLDISKDPSGGVVFIIITLWSLNMWFLLDSSEPLMACIIPHLQFGIIGSPILFCYLSLFHFLDWLVTFQ